MNSGTEKALGDGATALAITAGGTTSVGSFFGFLNGNAPAIGLLMTLVFGLIGVYFQWQRVNKADKSSENRDMIDEQAKEIERLHDELKKLSERG